MHAEEKILERLESILVSVSALHSKIDNFEGFFEASVEEVEEFEKELELARKEGTRLEELE